MKKIMIDMDDVICGGGFLKLVNDFLGTDYKEEDIHTYYIQDLIPEEKMQEWAKFFAQKNIYDYTQILPNAYNVMEELNKKYELYITTAYIFRDDKEKSSELLKNKFDYLIKNFPFIQPEQYIFTSNKEIVECQIKIDDKPSNLDGDAELKLLFTAYHNKNIPNEELQKNNLVRVNNWNEIGKILL